MLEGMRQTAEEIAEQDIRHYTHVLESWEVGGRERVPQNAKGLEKRAENVKRELL